MPKKQNLPFGFADPVRSLRFVTSDNACTIGYDESVLSNSATVTTLLKTGRVRLFVR